MMMNNLELLPEVANLVNQSDEERIKYISQRKWIDYPVATKIIEKLNFLRKYEQNQTRVTSMLLVGSANNGKTALLERFMELNPNYDLFASSPEILTKEYLEKYHACGIPVLYIVAPSEPNESRLYSEILKHINAPYKEKDAVSTKQHLVEYYFKSLHIEILIIDEIHNILGGSVKKQNQMMNAIKNLSNNLKIPIVLSGIKDSLRAVSTDLQMSSRFRPVYLTRWEMNEDYISLLATIAKTLPLRKESKFLNPETALEILNISNGYIGDIIGLFREAAIYAIQTKSERITIKEIKECDYQSMAEVNKNNLLQKV